MHPPWGFTLLQIVDPFLVSLLVEPLRHASKMLLQCLGKRQMGLRNKLRRTTKGENTATHMGCTVLKFKFGTGTVEVWG